MLMPLLHTQIDKKHDLSMSYDVEKKFCAKLTHNGISRDSLHKRANSMNGVTYTNIAQQVSFNTSPTKLQQQQQQQHAI